VADLAIFSDDGGTFDQRAGFDDGSGTDDDSVADAGTGKALGRILFWHFAKIGFNFFECVPGKGATVKNGGVFGLGKVKQVFSFEHGEKLVEISAPAKGNGRVHLRDSRRQFVDRM